MEQSFRLRLSLSPGTFSDLPRLPPHLHTALSPCHLSVPYWPQAPAPMPSRFSFSTPPDLRPVPLLGGGPSRGRGC